MSFFSAILTGAVIGFAFMAVLLRFMKWRADKRKKQSVAVTALNTIGMEELKKVLADKLPTYIKFSEFDESEWLNTQLKEIWAYVNKATSETVRASVEPTLEAYRPIGVSSITFSKFTLGYIAPRIEGIKCHKQVESQVILDLDFFWGGEPSIILAIKTIAATLSVQLKDLELRFTLRLIFQLGEGLPCIKAVVVSILSKPKMFLQYNLKAIGGSLSSIPGLSSQIDDMIRDPIHDMLVWPQRMVFPLDVGFDASSLEMKFTGCLRVVVVKAEGLKNVDMIGKSDPYVLLWTRPSHIFKTKIIDNNLNPKWNETFEIPVDDVHTAELFLKVKDEGMVNNDALGMVSVLLTDVKAKPNPLTLTLDLMPEIGNDRLVGPFGLGNITLILTYRDYTAEESEQVTAKEKTHDPKARDPSMTPAEIAAADAAAAAAVKKPSVTDVVAGVVGAYSAFKIYKPQEAAAAAGAAGDGDLASADEASAAAKKAVSGFKAAANAASAAASAGSASVDIGGSPVIEVPGSPARVSSTDGEVATPRRSGLFRRHTDKETPKGDGSEEHHESRREKLGKSAGKVFGAIKKRVTSHGEKEHVGDNEDS